MIFSKFPPYFLIILALMISASLSGCEKNSAESNKKFDPEFDSDSAATKWNTTSKKWTKKQLADLVSGELLYGKYCAACHLKNGQGNMTNGFPPLKGSAIVKGPIVQHISFVLYGKQGSAMPPFTNLVNSELAKIITYERNAWGNNSGDWVADKAIQQLRGAKAK